MIFGKDAVKACALCEHGKRLGTSDEMRCIYKGVVEDVFSCRKFKYDPLKRSPRPKPELPRYEEAEFKL